MKNKVMIVSGWVFPGTGGTIAILNNLAEYFTPDEAIVVGRPHVLEKEEEWPAHLPKLIHIDPILPKKGRTNKYRLFLRVPDLIRRLKKIAIKEKCTCIFSVFPCEFMMYAAYRVSKELDLPFYTWFHNTYFDNRQGIWGKIAADWQPKFFEHARTTFVMSEGMSDYYADVYPEMKFEPLEHGFVIPEVTYSPPPKPKKKVKFMFSGTLNESCLDASLRLFECIMSNPDYELHAFTASKHLFELHNIKGNNVFLYGFRPLKEFVALLPEFDIMLLPHGFEGRWTDAEYRTIFPTRTIPLLYSGRPILAHSPTGAFLTDFLKKYDCAEVVDQADNQLLEAAIQRLIEDQPRRNELVQNAIKTSDFFNVKRIGEKLKRIIFEK